MAAPGVAGRRSACRRPDSLWRPVVLPPEGGRRRLAGLAGVVPLVPAGAALAVRAVERRHRHGHVSRAARRAGVARAPSVFGGPCTAHLVTIRCQSCPPAGGDPRTTPTIHDRSSMAGAAANPAEKSVVFARSRARRAWRPRHAGRPSCPRRGPGAEDCMSGQAGWWKFFTCTRAAAAWSATTSSTSGNRSPWTRSVRRVPAATPRPNASRCSNGGACRPRSIRMRRRSDGSVD